MDFNRAVFKAYDIRGLKELVTPLIAEQVGRAMVAKLGAKTVLVARDMRDTSPQLSEALIKGVRAMGGDIVDIGLSTTSMYNWTATTMDVDMAAMVTASHNPSEYNGIKVSTSDGQPISGVELWDLVQEEFEDAESEGTYREKNVLNDYVDKVIETAGELPDFSDVKLVMDYGNGMGSLTLKPLLERLGVETVNLYDEPDSDFPNHEANPAKESTLVDVKQAVEEHEASFGVATDGDGDRIGFIDNESVSLRGDQALAVFAKDYLKKQPGAKVAVAPNHGWSALRSIEADGGELVYERIGRTFAIKKMRDSGAVVSGEISSHFFFEEFNALESIDYALLLMLKLWKASGQSFADFVRPLREYVNSGEVNTEVEDKEAVIEKIKEVYKPQAERVDELDGLRAEFAEDWWFIVRQSNTEPLIRLTVEAKTKEIVDQKVEEILEVMKSV